MFIYLLTQTERWDDAFDSAVVIAESAEKARYILPQDHLEIVDGYVISSTYGYDMYQNWVTHINNLTVTKLGTSDELDPRLVLASYNAG